MPLTLLETRVVEALRSLPRDRVEEVLDYIEFLTARETTRFLAGRLAESLAAMEVADAAEMSEDGCFTVLSSVPLA